MSTTDDDALRRFRESLREEFAHRFSRSRAALDARHGRLLDDVSHAMRWAEPFMPLVRAARGAAVEDLDGHRLVDYWQGHFANILGHNPAVVREPLVAALGEGRGLQSGMLHEVENEVAERICRCTATEALRLTTSGSLGTFYAVLLARAFTGRELVLKVSGGWHGSQPFALKGVAPHGESFDHLESEGLSASTGGEIVLTRFNDVEHLRSTFDSKGDRVACFLLEPVLGAGGGMVASREYLTEARRLTARHGALLLCDEIITGFRFRAGDLSAAYGVRPDLLILGKIVGGGMPVAAVAGRRDVLGLATRSTGRVKFEGGTYSAHELSLVASREIVRHLEQHEAEIYPDLARKGERMRRELRAVADAEGLPVAIAGPGPGDVVSGSLVFLHAVSDPAMRADSPEDLAANRHPRIGERLLKSVLLLEDVSIRSGLGAISTAHTDEDLQHTLESYRAALRRLKSAGLF